MSIRTPDEEWAVIEHPWTAPAPGGLARPGIDWRGVVKIGRASCRERVLS